MRLPVMISALPGIRKSSKSAERTEIFRLIHSLTGIEDELLLFTIPDTRNPDFSSDIHIMIDDPQFARDQSTLRLHLKSRYP